MINFCIFNIACENELNKIESITKFGISQSIELKVSKFVSLKTVIKI